MLLDARRCDPARLDDADAIEALMLQAAEAAGATVLHLHVACFAPQGVTATATLAESHLALHTWPELSHAAVDAFTCGTTDPEALCRAVAAGLAAADVRVQEVARGR